MPARHPYERFLRFLVTRKVGVNRVLRRVGLPDVESAWLEHESDRLRRTAPRAVRHYLDSSTPRVVFTDGFLDWAAREEIAALWQREPELSTGARDPVIETATSMFLGPLTRAIAGLLLCARVPFEEAAAILRERCDVVADGAILDAYQTLYWDTRSIDADALLALVRTFDADERSYVGVGLHRPTLAKVRVLLGLGGEVDSDRVLGTIVRHAEYQFVEAMDGPDPDARNAFRWADLAIRAVRALGKKPALGAGKGDASPADQFALFSVRVERIPIPTLDELQGMERKDPDGE